MSNNNISFILHKPQLSENIGACARAMKNFNFQKMIVVDPKPIYPNDKILATSVGAKNIISKSKNFDNLETALKNIDIVIVGPEEPLVDGLADYLNKKKALSLESAFFIVLV